jgi:hypothetical protein
MKFQIDQDAWESNTPVTHLNIALATFVKNDPDILPYWLEYHAAIFGAENIAVIDHNSTNKHTIQVLEYWQAKGVHVQHTNVSYLLKGQLTYQAFETYFAKTADLFIPLDIDEFLIYYDHQQRPIANRAFIQQGLLDMWQDRKKTNKCWGLLHNYNSHPTHLNDTMDTISQFAPYSRPLSNSKKIVAKAPTLVGLDHGNHCPHMLGSSCGKCQGLENIGVLHYHFRNPRETAKRAIVDLIGLDHLDKEANIDNIREFKHQLLYTIQHGLGGIHKAKELMAFVNEGMPGMLKCMYNVYPKQGEVVEVATIKELISRIKST